MNHKNILILDFGSQFTQLIARKIRELGYYSQIQVGDLSLVEIKNLNPAVVILSGGPFSVFESKAPKLATEFWTYQKQEKIPVLGICYGMQLLIYELGGKVQSSKNREYGRQKIKLQFEKLSNYLGANDFSVWMSHGDQAVSLPDSFQLGAVTEKNIPAIIVDETYLRLGIQFHPEVSHTENGIDLLKYFLSEFSNLKVDWKMNSVRAEQIEKIRSTLPRGSHVLCALSGGVDSTVAATLVYEAIGDRLHCCFVDHGMLRFEEQKRVMDLFKNQLHLPVECVDASQKFITALKGITDPERKRKIIGRLFIETFDIHSKKIEEKIGKPVTFLVQGTLYPDVIESSPPPESKQKYSATIKSHHNVGGLPEQMKFELIEPLRFLFKDEVRLLGKELNVPEAFLKRHPFPGPGLALRIIGEITDEKLKILRRADEIFISMLHEKEIYDEIWQAFAVFLPVQSVGVQGDGRTYENVLALRAVTSNDGMTADWYPFDPAVLAEISNRISNEVKGINRVVYDISSKPPATIEWE